MPVVDLSQLMNCSMVKVSGRLEPEPLPEVGAGVATSVSVGVLGSESSTGVATGLGTTVGVAVLEGAADETGAAVSVGVVGAGALPDEAPSQTAGPGIS